MLSSLGIVIKTDSRWYHASLECVQDCTFGKGKAAELIIAIMILLRPWPADRTSMTSSCSPLESSLISQAVPANAEEKKSDAALNSDEWRSFKVMKKWPVTHNTQGLR